MNMTCSKLWVVKNYECFGRICILKNVVGSIEIQLYCKCWVGWRRKRKEPANIFEGWKILKQKCISVRISCCDMLVST